ncbi:MULTISPECIES: TlpA family protein disulfide reductase [unclassified Saccharicrinis]|uniref:TlpA family protein disulfide reductase n=1 Tax=unclassified Saccharicrinis TaxID=2646859 RepID=UPI003D34C54A
MENDGKKKKLGVLVVLFWVTVVSCAFSQNNVPKVIDFKQLNERIDLVGRDSILVVNFWATWCKPCVEEMPVIESIATMQKEVPVKVLLVSLDFPEKIESKLVPFIKKRAILSEVVVLDERNPNDWIPKIDDQWSGGIPACLFIYKNKTIFHEGQVSPEFIENTLNSLLL